MESGADGRGDFECGSDRLCEESEDFGKSGEGDFCGFQGMKLSRRIAIDAKQMRDYQRPSC